MSEDEKFIVIGRNQCRKLVEIEDLKATNIAIFKDKSTALGVIYNQYIMFSQCIHLKLKEITIIYDIT